MPSQHKHPPIPFRPAEGDRSWLLERAQLTGQPVNAILREALAAYRAGNSASAVLALADQWAAEPSKVYQHCARKIRESVAMSTANCDKRKG